MSFDLDRRQFTAVMAAAAAGLAVPRPLRPLLRPRSTFFRWTAINADLHVAIGAGGNSLVIKGVSGNALVDCKFLGVGDRLREQAMSAVSGPISTVFNTHHHNDHTGGNHVFSDTKIIAQANAAPRIEQTITEGIQAISDDPETWLAQTFGFWEIELDAPERASLLEFAAAVGQLDVATFAPDETFDRRLAYADLGVELHWRHVGPGHTDNDAFLFLPEHNVMHAGDLLFFGRHAFMRGTDGGNTVGWQRSLAAAIATCDDDTVVIPGHGPITNKSGLREQSRYFDTLRALIVTAMDEDRPRETVVEMIRPDEFRDYEWPDILPQLIGIMYDELS